MSELSVFSFSEKLPVRVSNINGEPWFVARDVATCLDYTPSSIASPNKLFGAVPDQWKGMQEFETRGGKQKLLALSEQGLYFFLGRSDKPKALPFQMWLAGEVLPTIRKTGRYECDNHTTINEAQQREIQRAVGKRAAKTKCFAAVYRALKNHFNIPRYTCLLAKDFEEAIAFIETCELQTPVAPEPEQPTDGRCPCCGLTPLPKDCVVLTADEAKALLTFIYYVRFVCSDAFERFHGMLRLMKSPLAGKIWDAFHEVPWTRILTILANNGYDIRDMDCYKHWLAKKAA